MKKNLYNWRSSFIAVLSSMLLVATSSTLCFAAIPDGKKVVGYFPYYRMDKLASIHFENVTHVSYWALDADVNGNLLALRSYTAGLPAVVAAVHGAGKKVSVCVGGWLTDEYFSPIAHSATARANFIGQLVNYCRNNNLDGVDLDWEPVANEDVASYGTLIKELKTALAPYGLLLSVAVDPTHYDIPSSAAPYLDWVSLMTYCMNYLHADHSTYSDTVAAMTFWAQSGVEKNKLLMGVPFWGYDEGWNNEPSYSEIVSLYNPAPSVNNIGGFGFNGLDLIKAKTAYSLNSGFGGMMIWELGQDQFDDRSLLSALAASMGVEPVPVIPLPAQWQTADIGAVGMVGRSSVSNGVFAIAGAGANIGGRVDAFRFAYQTLSGDGEIKVRMLSQSSTYAKAKSGVMIRESLNANARYALMDVTGDTDYGFQVRSKTGGSTATTWGGLSYPAPQGSWLRLVRSGRTITAYKSPDGAAWVKVKSVTVAMGTNIYIGLAVTSHNTSALNMATFDRIAVVP